MESKLSNGSWQDYLTLDGGFQHRFLFVESVKMNPSSLALHQWMERGGAQKLVLIYKSQVAFSFTIF